MNSLKGGTQNQVHQEIEGTPQGTRQSTRKGSSKPSTPTLDDQGSGNQGSGDSGKPPRASKQKPDELKIESVFLGTEIIAQLKIANSALGRKSPSYFANPQQRDQFDVALKTLNGQGKALIVKGIAQRGTGLSALGAWLEACAKNQNQPRYQKQSGSGVTLLEAIQQSQEADSGD